METKTLNTNSTLIVEKWPEEWKMTDLREILTPFYQKGGFWLKPTGNHIHVLFEDSDVCREAYLCLRNNQDLEVVLPGFMETSLRPVTTNLVAHRLIAGALGISPNRDPEILAREKAKIEKARLLRGQMTG
jgi:hypothetical protein